MTLQAEIDAAFALQLGQACGAAVGDKIDEVLKHGRHQPSYPPGVVQADSKAVVLTTGAPVLGNSVGPMLGWAWRINRISVVGATGGTGSNPVPSQPAVPASGTAVQNTNAYPVTVTLSGFTLTQVFVNGILVGSTNGPYLVPSGGAISVTYSVAGTWTWADANPAPSTGSYAVYRQTGLGLQDQILPPAGVSFSPNGTYEPSRLVARYGYSFNAVGSGLAAGGAGLLVVDFFNIREDWLADAVT
jgi:hypothetical protein